MKYVPFKLYLDENTLKKPCLSTSSFENNVD